MSYREIIRHSKLTRYTVRVKESNLLIYSDKRLSRVARCHLHDARRQIEGYSKRNPEFATSFNSLKIDKNASPLIKKIFSASKDAGVGPMASVAGAIAEYVGNALLQYSSEVIVENGGDIFLKTANQRIIAVFAGKSPLSKKIALILPKSKKAYGVCTSSGTVGHSFSYGRADAVVVVSYSCPHADAWATRIANEVTTEADIKRAVCFFKRRAKIIGGLIIKGSKLAAAGDISIKKI